MDSHGESDHEARGAGQRATDAARKAQEYAASLVDQQKQRAAQELDRLGSAIRESAERMQDQRDLTLAGYAETVANHLQRAGGYIERQNVNTMLTDAQRFARRRPELVVGGMFVAGVALARFLKAGSTTSSKVPAAATADEETFVPHSKRPDEALASSPRGDGLMRLWGNGGESSTPRGISSAAGSGTGELPRPIEAAGGDLSDQRDTPPMNPKFPNSNPEGL